MFILTYDSRAVLTPPQARLFYEEGSIKRGEQIWNTYGDQPNADLLRKYGHVDVIPLNKGGLFSYGNPSDDVEIPADLIFDICLPGTGGERKFSKIEAWLNLDEPEEWVLPFSLRGAHLVW
jgi:SET domain-containing protein 6